MRTSLLSRCGPGTPVAATPVELLARWRALSLAKPASQTAEALSLLADTVAVTASASAAVSPTSAPHARPLPTATSGGSALLADRGTSLLVWKTLRRQRVPWESAAALAAPQLASMAPAQRHFVRARVRGRPWAFSHAVLTSWDRQDASMAAVYRELGASRTAVEMAQRVEAALRSRPELDQVLPVTVAVLRHCYALGLREGEGAAGDGAAAVALELSRHLALLGSDALSKRAREALTLDYARLHARTGDWAAALEVVTTSHVVRLSAKDAFAAFVRQRQLHESGTRLDRKLVPSAVAHAPTWTDALKLLQCHPFSDDDARLAFLKRADVVRVAGATGVLSPGSEGGAPPAQLCGLTWHSLLELFGCVAPSRQTYGTLRPLLEMVPPSLPEYIVVCTDALRPTATRMYAGALTRRVHALERRGEVAAAVALCSAAGYYDVADRLTRRLGPCPGGGGGGAYALPADLLLFMKTASALRRPVLDGGGDGVAAIVLSPAAGLPELLAHALYGDWRAVAEVERERGCGDARLAALLAARQASSGATGGVDRAPCLRERTSRTGESEANMADAAAGCYTFASADTTQLVCRHATEGNRRYFAQVIPRALHVHHFGAVLPARGRGSGGADDSPMQSAATPPRADGGLAPHDTGDGLVGPQLVETLEDCHRLLRGVCHYLRAQSRTGEVNVDRPAPTDEALLRLVARACASGRVCLSTAERFALALATLRASEGGGLGPTGRLDALTAVTAFESVPSYFLDPCAPAVAAGVNAQLLTGKTRACIAVYHRWARKQQEASDAIPCLLSPRSASDTAVGEGDHLADVYARAALHLPRAEAGRWARLLWRAYRRPGCLLLQELLAGDTRGVVDCVRDATGDVPLRRRLLGMAVCLLDTTASLRSVVQAAGRERVAATDVDEHGVQRLVRALPVPLALVAFAQLHEAGERVEVVWLLHILGRAEGREEAAGAANAALTLAPSSPLVNAYAVLLRALGGAGTAEPARHDHSPAAVDALLALKAIRRFTELTLTAYEPCAGALYGTISSMARHYSAEAQVVVALLAAPAEVQREANANGHRILHALLSRSDLGNRLRRERREMVRLLGEPEAVSSVILLGWLHHALSRHMRVPVAAAFTSQLLRVTVAHTRDWVSAFRLFDLLRRPTREECVLLLTALAHSPRDLTARLQHTPRLLRTNPELALVWAGSPPPASGEEAPRSSPSFTRRLTLSCAILTGEEEGGLGCAPGEEAGWESGSVYALSHGTQSLVDEWTVADCTRALGILRQMRLLEERHTADGRVVFSLASADPRVRACLEAVAQRLRTVEPTPSDVALPIIEVAP